MPIVQKPQELKVPVPAVVGVSEGAPPPAYNSQHPYGSYLQMPSAPNPTTEIDLTPQYLVQAPPPVVVTVPAERHTVIGGHLPVEVDCWDCHAHIVTHTQRVREDKGNCCFRVCLPLMACLSLVPLILYLISWTQFNDEQKKQYANSPIIVTVLAVVCFFLCCCLPHLCRTSQDWRMYHTCPNCGKQLANVPADAPVGPGQFYSVRNV